MNEEVTKILNALGCMAETLSYFRDQCMQRGFSRKEAIDLCHTYLSTMLSKGGGNDEN
jgi:hypothetical protein